MKKGKFSTRILVLLIIFFFNFPNLHVLDVFAFTISQFYLLQNVPLTERGRHVKKCVLPNAQLHSCQALYSSAKVFFFLKYFSFKVTER